MPASALGDVARAEDHLAGRILGYACRDLGLAGAQDRHGLPLARTLGWSETDVRTDPALALEMRALADRLAAVLSEPARNGAMILAPAGIGGHLDHVLVALAARLLLTGRVLEPAHLVFYEDLPYAAATSRPPQHALSRPVTISRDALALKLAALGVFRTRLRARQIALGKAHVIILGGDDPPAEMTFAAAPAARLPMDSGGLVGSMAP